MPHSAASCELDIADGACSPASHAWGVQAWLLRPIYAARLMNNRSFSVYVVRIDTSCSPGTEEGSSAAAITGGVLPLEKNSS